MASEDELVVRCKYHPSYNGKEPLIVECSGCNMVRSIADIIRRYEVTELHYHYHDLTGKTSGNGYVIGNESLCDMRGSFLTNA